jgi:hypothetical protein
LVQSVEELPRYLAEVVELVSAGIQTTREFAERQSISISNASERFRVARKLGWIERVEEEYKLRQGFRYTLSRVRED